MTAVDPHRCRRGIRCTRRTPDPDGEPVGALLGPRDRGLCPRDRQILLRALRELPDLWAALRALITPSMAAPAAGSRGGSRTPPLPLRADPLVLADQIRDELAGWAALVRASARITRRRLRVPDTVHPDDAPAWRAGETVRADARLLEHAVDALLDLPARPLRRWLPDGHRQEVAELDGVDGAIALLELHRIARAGAGLDHLVHRLPGPCPRCSSWGTLRRDNGASEAHCENCGSAWPEERYQFFSRVLLDDLAANAACELCDELGRRHDDPNGPLCDHQPRAASGDELEEAPAC